MKPSSWIIKRKATGEVMFETFNPAVVAKLNRKNYTAIPILEYLVSINGKATA